MDPRRVLGAYQDCGYWALNLKLRLAEGDDTKLDIDTLCAVKAIDSLFETDGELESGILWRGDGSAIATVLFERVDIPSGVLIDHESLLRPGPWGRDVGETLTKQLCGVEFTDYGYVSASRDRDLVVRKFISGHGEIGRDGGQGLMEIVVDNVPCLNVDAITGARVGEDERLLPRGTTFRIDGVQVLRYPNSRRVYLKWKCVVVS